MKHSQPFCQTAGVAAHLAIQNEVEVRKVPVQALRTLLTSQGRVTRHK